MSANDFGRASVAIDTLRQRREQERQQRLADALLTAHMDVHELLAEVAVRVDSVNPDEANWGNVGDLNYIAALLRQALGRES